MTRIQILSSFEIKSFETPPEFNIIQKKKYFSLSKWAEDIVETLRTETNKVGFILQLGYFKSEAKFFTSKKFHFDDIKFICDKINIDIAKVKLEEYIERTFIRHQEIILEYFCFGSFDEIAKNQLLEEARSLTSKQLKPIHIFRYLTEFLYTKKTEIPAFNTISDTIIQALSEHESKLILILENRLTEDHKTLLDGLLEKDEIYRNEKKDSKIKRYKITFLKDFNHDIKSGQIKENIDQLQYLQYIYEELKNVIEGINLSPSLLEYYAVWTKKTQVFQVYRKSDFKKYLYLISFVIHQYYVLQDLLIDKFIRCVQGSINTAKKDYKAMFYEFRNENVEKTNKITKYSQKMLDLNQEIIKILENKSLTAKEQIELIKMLVYSQTSERENITIDILLSEFERENSNIQNDIYHYSKLEEFSVSLQTKVSQIIKNLDFNENTSDSNIIEAIKHFRQTDGKLGKDAPTDFLKEKKEKIIIYDDNGKLRISLYKILLFKYIAHAIKSGILNLRYSYRYKSFEEYLILKEYWEKDKDELLKKAALTEFKDLIFLLNKYRELLDEQYKITNENILNESNNYFKSTKNGGFSVSTPKKENDFENILSDVFPQQRFISLLEILTTVNKSSKFLESFEHYGDKYIKERPSDSLFYASIMGYGCNIGVNKISQISQGINESELDTVTNWYFSIENIQNANDKILEFMEQMDITKAPKKNPDITHTSSDGQKFLVSKESLTANQSFKYFGKGKGVSVYNFIDDRHFSFYSTVINSSEREAAYVLDGLLHNDVIKSDIHSTDTHGYTEIVFGATHLLGFNFAPRIKNLKQQLLYSFKEYDIKSYQVEGYEILPDRYINEEIIKENWDDVLRLIVTIKLKETTASQLFKRLTSYSKENPLYRALKAFGQIIKTIFILEYINKAELRQDIQGQLNKSENSNKFSDAIMVGDSKELDYKTKEEQDVVAGCTRLIKNGIICWNYIYLTNLLSSTKDKKEGAKILDSLKNGSIVMWQHINFNGEYDFSKKKMEDSFNFDISKILNFKCDKMDVNELYSNFDEIIN